MAAVISWVEADTDNNRYDAETERAGGLSALNNWENLARQCDQLIEAGAVVVPSRELVRRLRAAGLRLSPAERRARTS